MTINSGEIIGFLGPNGAGKTTSFRMIAGLTRPDTGEIHIDHHEISRSPVHKRSNLGLGYLPQEASIFRKLTVAENIMSILQTRTDLNDDQASKQLENLLNEFNISHLRNNLGKNLSGGERRRVEIARSLTTNPRFLLLDEPFAGIDPITVEDIQKLTRYLGQRGIGILITDHNVRETLRSCDRAYIIDNGQIIAHGGSEEILNNEQVKKNYLGHNFSL